MVYYISPKSQPALFQAIDSDYNDLQQTLNQLNSLGLGYQAVSSADLLDTVTDADIRTLIINRNSLKESFDGFIKAILSLAESYDTFRSLKSYTAEGIETLESIATTIKGAKNSLEAILRIDICLIDIDQAHLIGNVCAEISNTLSSMTRKLSQHGINVNRRNHSFLASTAPSPKRETARAIVVSVGDEPEMDTNLNIPTDLSETIDLKDLLNHLDDEKGAFVSQSRRDVENYISGQGSYCLAIREKGVRVHKPAIDSYMKVLYCFCREKSYHGHELESVLCDPDPK
jgi:hypothetical protein